MDELIDEGHFVDSCCGGGTWKRLGRRVRGRRRSGKGLSFDKVKLK